MATIFFSWQVDAPTGTGRNLIERALSDAITALKADAEVEEAERDELVIDKDTQGVAGSPHIMDTIFAKIDAARAFLADLTFVGTRADGRRMPNPNVTIEFGWALKSLGNSYIIAVMNTAYGDPKEHALPFDLGHLRHPIQFNCPDGADEATRKLQRRQLADQLKDAVKAVLALPAPRADAVPAAYVLIAPKDGRARFRARGEPIGVLEKQLSFSTGFEAPQMMMVADGPAMWLRVMRTTPGREMFSTRAVQDAMTPSQQVVYPLNFFPQHVRLWRSRADDGYAVAIGAGDETPLAVVQAFTAGEVWSFDTFFLSANEASLHLVERHFTDALCQFAGVLARLGIAGPYKWIAGLEGVRGRQITQENSFGVHHCAADLIEADGTFSGESADANAALEPFFAKVYDMCGLQRPLG